MAAGDETPIYLTDDWQYLGPESEKITFARDSSGPCRIAVSTVANDISSVANDVGRSLGPGEIWQTCNDSASVVHLYGKGSGVIIKQEGV